MKNAGLVLSVWEAETAGEREGIEVEGKCNWFSGVSETRHVIYLLNKPYNSYLIHRRTTFAMKKTIVFWSCFSNYPA